MKQLKNRMWTAVLVALPAIVAMGALAPVRYLK